VFRKSIGTLAILLNLFAQQVTGVSLRLHESEPAFATDARISFQIAIVRSIKVADVSPFVLRNKSPRPSLVRLAMTSEPHIRKFTYMRTRASSDFPRALSSR
jgi:hypothetical protein